MRAATLDLFPPKHDPGCKVRVRWPEDSTVTARFSPCERYRTELREIWDAARWLCQFLLMNPSGAGLNFADLTVQKTGKIARWLGAGGQIISNVHDYRATDNAELHKVDAPESPENLPAIVAAAREARMRIIAFGQPFRVRGLEIARAIAAEGLELHALRLSADGTPMHPLSRGKGFIPVCTTPIRWEPI